MSSQVCKRVASLTAVAALVAGVTTTASAQARPTSQQRIPVQKESAGEVARRDSAARADSIAAVEAARRDSIARAEAAARQDSITKAEMARRDSIARADSIAKAAAAAAAVEAARRDSIAREDSIRNAAAQAQAALAKRGFVFGLAGGYSATSGKYGDVYDPGWNVTVPFGWHRQSSRWGVRADIAYDSHGGKFLAASAAPPAVSQPIAGAGGVTSNYDFDNSTVWSGNLDGVLDLAEWGKNRLGAFYLLGGGGVHFFSKKKANVTPTTGTSAGITTSSETDSQTKFGLNAGVGLAFGLGRSAMFIESRYFTAYTDNTNSDWIPVILGIKFR
jgi:hypothetical protein